MKNIYCTLILSLFVSVLLAQNISDEKKLPQLLLRIDDIGMNHATNLAIRQVAETGIPFSASVMFACPWYQETVAILKDYPNADVGVHLTLTAEWKYYRWGPVLGQTAVPSLVDSLGYFFPTGQQLKGNNYNIDEIEKELTAQIERALGSGLAISYVDPHMGVALSTPELVSLTERLANKYGLGISTLNNNTYYGETYKDMWGVPVEKKKEEFLSAIQNLSIDVPNLVILHIAHSTPEMDVLIDMNSPLMSATDGTPQASMHRQTELDMILSQEFRDMINSKFELINYKILLEAVSKSRGGN